MKRLLLISNSTLHGSGYLDHCADEIQDFLGNQIKDILFVPFARPGGLSHDEYTEKANVRYKEMGYNLVGVHTFENQAEAVNAADAVFIGGGNTFVLLDGLYKNNILQPLRDKINNGMPYIGTSAGSNVACPTIMTTNDMPVRELQSFKAIDAFPYQINAHYLDPDPDSKHQGETRETRLNEFHIFNDRPVVALREGCMVRVEGDDMQLKGSTDARIFLPGKEAFELQPPCELKI